MEQRHITADIYYYLLLLLFIIHYTTILGTYVTVERSKLGVDHMIDRKTKMFGKILHRRLLQIHKKYCTFITSPIKYRKIKYR